MGDLLRLPAHAIAGLGIARTFQNLALVPGLSVVENVMIGAHARSEGGFVASTLGFPARRTERRLRTDANPLILHVYMGAGHGGSSGRFEHLKDVARQQAFFLDLAGIAD